MDRSSKKRASRTLRGLFRKGMIFLAVSLLASCSQFRDQLDLLSRQNGPERQQYSVPVVRGEITDALNFVGNLQYSQSVSLTWKTAGVVDSVSVIPGDRVKKGDILAVLETDSLPASVILAEKTMIEQQENLEDIRNSESARMKAYQTLAAKETALKQAKLKQEALYYPRATRQEMELAWDTLALATLNFSYAQQDYDEVLDNNWNWEDGSQPPRTVWFRGRAVSFGGDDRSSRQRRFEDYVSGYEALVSAYSKYVWTTGQPKATDYAVAEGNVRVAQIEYDRALEDYLSYDTLPREKDVSAAEAMLKNAEALYNQRYITARFDGIITSVSASEGCYVTRGSEAVRIDDMSRIFIPVSIPELDLGSVSGGAAVSITVDAITGKTYSGHIYAVSDAGTAEGTATTFSAVVEVDDPDERMLSGMTAEISIPLPPRTDVILIPNSAVTYDNGTPHVTVAGTEADRIIPIRLGVVSGEVSEVISGNLGEGMRLVVSSVSKEALTRLGLDPSEVAEHTRKPAVLEEERPTSAPLYVRSGEDPTETPRVKSTAAAVPSPTPFDPASVQDSEAVYVRELPESTAGLTKTSAAEPDGTPVPEEYSASPTAASAAFQVRTDVPGRPFRSDRPMGPGSGTAAPTGDLPRPGRPDRTPVPEDSSGEKK